MIAGHLETQCQSCGTSVKTLSLPSLHIYCHISLLSAYPGTKHGCQPRLTLCSHVEGCVSVRIQRVRAVPPAPHQRSNALDIPQLRCRPYASIRRQRPAVAEGQLFGLPGARVEQEVQTGVAPATCRQYLPVLAAQNGNRRVCLVTR